MQDNAPPAAPSRRWPWFVLAGAVLIGGGASFAFWRPWPAETTFAAKLLLAVRPAATQDLVNVDEAGALPVRDGGAMAMQVSYTQPAHTYLIWIDTLGKAIPLYPWNMQSVDVEDLNEPPPTCQATKLLLSPMTLGSSWPLGKGAGLETVLLLARRTPLSKDMRLGELLGKLAPAKLRHPGELSVLALDGSARLTPQTLVAVNRGAAEETRALDAPLLALLERLRPHFELIQVARFAHAGK